MEVAGCRVSVGGLLVLVAAVGFVEGGDFAGEDGGVVGGFFGGGDEEVVAWGSGWWFGASAAERAVGQRLKEEPVQIRHDSAPQLLQTNPTGGSSAQTWQSEPPNNALTGMSK